MANNFELDSIVEAAVEIARGKQHEFVMTEHLLLSMVRHAPFRRSLDRYG